MSKAANWVLILIAFFIVVLSPAALHAAPTSTTTTLSIMAGGVPVSSVAASTKVTLSAKVQSGAVTVTTGQILFCNAPSKLCTDINQVGTAQITSAGVASISMYPTPGAHSYTAVFLQTPNAVPAYAGSTSTAVALTVTGSLPSGAPYPTTTQLTATGSVGNYTLKASVSGYGAGSAPSGSVSFLDFSNSNASIGSATVSGATPGFGFVENASASIGLSAYQMAVGDFNGDGKPDVVVANSGSANMTVGINNGNGTFTTATVAGPGGEPVGVAVGDFNSDGTLDFIVISQNGNYLTTYLGNGNGTFTQLSTKTALSTYSCSPQNLTVGDFNGDGILDVAIACQNTVVSTDGNALVFMGNGDGTFSAPTGLFSYYWATGVIAGDFNNDGKLDVIVVYGQTGAMNIEFYPGNGDGTFGTRTVLPGSGYDGTRIVVADFNGDGNLDFALLNSPDTDVFLGDGTGSFSEETLTNFQVGGLSGGDFNGDGIPDLAGILDQTVTYALGNGDGTFSIPMLPNATWVTSAQPTGAVAGDFNMDGFTDLLTAWVSVPDDLGHIAVLQSEPTETAVAALKSAFVPGSSTQSVFSNYAGDTNYSASTSSTVSLTPGLAPPTFSPPGSTYTYDPSVTILDADTGVTIYYTTDGSTPSTSSTQYTGPITVSTSETVQAIAVKSNYPQSTVGTAAYTIPPPTSAPTFSIPAGTYLTAQLVAISDLTPGASIYYTTNGQTPTTGSTLYIGAVPISSNTTLQAIALTSGDSQSAVTSASYIIAGPPTTVSASPSSATGVAQVFTLTYADSSGASSIARAYVNFGSTISGSNSCYVYYTSSANSLTLLSDSGAAAGTVVPGSTGTLSNSQCTLNAGGSSVARSGNNLTLTLSITAKPAYTGIKNTYLIATDTAGQKSNNGNWQVRGTWIPATPAPPSVNSVSPSAPTGTVQSFTLSYSSAAGGSYIAKAWAVFGANTSSNKSCYVYYTASNHSLTLLSDTGTVAGTVTPGSSGTVQNSQCTVNGTGSSATVSGSKLSLVVAVVAKPAYIGLKNIYLLAQDEQGQRSNSNAWKELGTWIPTSPVPPTVNSASPNAATGTTQSFTLSYSSAGGGSYISKAWVVFGSSTSSSGNCYLYYTASSHSLTLLSDTGAVAGTVTPSVAGTVQNSQCTVNGTGSSATVSGNNLSLVVSVTAKSAYTGLKNIYLLAEDEQGQRSNSNVWKVLGSWTP